MAREVRRGRADREECTSQLTYMHAQLIYLNYREEIQVPTNIIFFLFHACFLNVFSSVMGKENVSTLHAT